MTKGFDWTPADVYAAQAMCPYETVSYGFSKFCDLFTYEEWQGFGYAIDLIFSGHSGFHSPTGVTHPRSQFQHALLTLRRGPLAWATSRKSWRASRTTRSATPGRKST